MPGSNDFLTFAGGVGANVVTQGAYAALTTTLANGFTSGTAESAKLNKVWRQSAIMSAVLAQYIVDETGANAVDDGTTTTLLSNLKDATLSLVERTTFTVGGTVDAITATYTRPPIAFKVGVSYFLRSAGANTSVAPTFTPNSGVLLAKTIVKFGNTALVAGDIGIAGHWLELVYDATLDKWQLQNPVIVPGVVISPATTTPLVESGAGAVGTGTTYARNDHVHPAAANSGVTSVNGLTGAVTIAAGAAAGATCTYTGSLVEVGPISMDVNAGASCGVPYGGLVASGTLDIGSNRAMTGIRTVAATTIGGAFSGSQMFIRGINLKNN